MVLSLPLSDILKARLPLMSCGGVAERWNPAHNLHENQHAFQLPSNLEGLFLGGGGGILHSLETN